MKKQVSIISRLAVVALAAGALCNTGSAFGQYASPTPESMSGMASSRVKPNKAELAKMKAEKEGNATTSTTSQLDSQDRDFMMEAAKGGMAEVDMGKMAENKGQSADVKNFGKMMVTDHSKANRELMNLAQKKGLKLDTRHPMEKMSDTNFDQSYMDAMVKDHKKDIAAFEKEAQKGKDADVKAWASNTLPTLKKHLKAAEDAQKAVKKSR